MTGATREAIFVAVYALMRAATVGGQAAATVSRVLKHWNDVPVSEQPALFLSQKSQQVAQLHGLPPKWTLAADLYVYVHGESADQMPATQLNNWLDALETAFAPTANQPQTLGGLVQHCWIKSVETDEGTLGPQAVAIVTLEIVSV